MVDIKTCPLTNLVEEDSRRRLCGGRLLLRIRLASDEVAVLKEPPPLFQFVTRLSYVPFVFNDVHKHFQDFLAPEYGQPYEIWLDFNNLALKWQYPIGVLCDVLIGDEIPTPVDLTAHFRSCPTNEVMPFHRIPDLQRVFMNSFREAIFQHHRSAAPFMRLEKNAQTQLWESIAAGLPAAAYTEVQRDLLCKNLSQCESLAVRIHIYGPPHQVLHRPCAPLEDDGSPRTVARYLEAVLPPVLQDNFSLREGVQILTQGVHVPLDTPLYWLALHASYLDQFVHLVIRMPPEMFEPGSTD